MVLLAPPTPPPFSTIVVDPGCLPRIRFFPSRIRIFFHPGFRIRIKVFKYYFQPKKMVSKLCEIWSGLFIPDPDFLPIPDPGSRGQKGTGSRIWIPNTAFNYQSTVLTTLLDVSRYVPTVLPELAMQADPGGEDWSQKRRQQKVWASSYIIP